MTTITTLTFPSGRKLEKISLIKAFPALSLYSAEEHITETVDEFSSSNEIIRPVWLAISNRAEEKTLQQWKDWSRNVKDYFGVECKEAAIIDNRLSAILTLDNAQLVDQFPDSKGALFVSSLCDMALRLDSIGFGYKYWAWSNIVQVGDCWKLLPSPSLERTAEPNPSQALSNLGKWLLEIKTPFLQTQPARSIVELIASGKFPEEFNEEIIYAEFWKSQQQRNTPLQVNATQDQNTIRLEWESTDEEILLLQTDGKKNAYSGQFVWHDNLEQYGTPLTDVSGINPVIDINSSSAQWSRPQDQSKYQTLTITPAVRLENWYEWGVPVAVGGPEEAVLKGVYFDEESNEVVIAPSWSDDRNISKMYFVIRSDRFANNVKDAQPVCPPVVVDRRLINHPIRKRILFSFKIYVVAFNAVRADNRVYFSPGQADCCRKIVTVGRR